MKPATLSKSRFKLALECPRKLVYAADPKHYPSTRADDEFLDALARSGHAIGELARRQYPDVQLIDAPDSAAQCAATARRVAQADVSLAEATFQYRNLLVRVDLLIKSGSDVRLIEVKSKSRRAAERVLGKGGEIRSEWLPYLQDVAFQTYVVRHCHPEWRVRPVLLLVDPGVRCTADRLGTRIRVEGRGRDLKLVVDTKFRIEELSSPLLREWPVDEEVERILEGSVEMPGSRRVRFEEFVGEMEQSLVAGTDPAPIAGPSCRKCEFYVPPREIGPDVRSGWHECMARLSTSRAVERSESVLALHRDTNSRVGLGLLTRGHLALAGVPDALLPADGAAEASNFRPVDRQRFQFLSARDPTLLRLLKPEGIRAAFANLKFPLHFIDFETARSPLPYHRGQRPNQVLLFQYSHHRLTAEGQLSHASEALVAEPGVAPSTHVLRAMQNALSQDLGTVIHWWDHERNVLKELREELETSAESDRDSLMRFIDALIGGAPHEGRLFDLGRMVSQYAMFAGTSGNSSIKKVLPAVLAQSDWLRRRFGRPTYGTPEMPSHNFGPGWQWFQEKEGAPVDPYTLLGPLYTDSLWQEALEEPDDEQAVVRDGGGAMVAYGQLQNEALPASERERYRRQLLRYCELDTLAMVLVSEALGDWTSAGAV
jgi:hypothetical protein